MATLTSTKKTELNKMNRVAKDTTLGTLIQNLQVAVGASGSYTVTSSDQGGSVISIPVTLIGTASGSIAGGVVQHRRGSGSILASGYVVYSGSTITYKVSSGCVYSGDLLNYFVF